MSKTKKTKRGKRGKKGEKGKEGKHQRRDRYNNICLSTIVWRDLNNNFCMHGLTIQLMLLILCIRIMN